MALPGALPLDKQTMVSHMTSWLFIGSGLSLAQAFYRFRSNLLRVGDGTNEVAFQLNFHLSRTVIVVSAKA